MTAASVLETRRVGRVERVSLPGGGARDDRLYFAQVREDARVEVSALEPGPDDRVVVVSSGGCTALSLLGAGAGEVHAVDLNRTQNHLLELKMAAVRHLERHEAIGFLGGAPASGAHRRWLYARLRTQLTYAARTYWDRHETAVSAGALDAGASERFIRVVCWLVRNVVHSDQLVHRMLACRSLAEQRTLFDREWNTRRWRWLFAALLNRWSMSRAYDPRFFANIGRANFAEHFLRLARHALTEVPIADNYFLHKMFTGRYPVERAEGVPAYLGEEGFAEIRNGEGQLLLVDASVTGHLRTLPDRSVNAFALSNVCEWLDEAGTIALFREVERVAAPGARVVFRNFVGWTELPATCIRLKEDRERSAALIRGDRSGVQSRVVFCQVQS